LTELNRLVNLVRMKKLNRIKEYLQKAGYEKGEWSDFARVSDVPIWRLSKILRRIQDPSLSDMYKITDAFERIFNKKFDPRDIFYAVEINKSVKNKNSAKEDG